MTWFSEGYEDGCKFMITSQWYINGIQGIKYYYMMQLFVWLTYNSHFSSDSLGYLWVTATPKYYAKKLVVVFQNNIRTWSRTAANDTNQESISFNLISHRFVFECWQKNVHRERSLFICCHKTICNAVPLFHCLVSSRRNYCVLCLSKAAPLSWVTSEGFYLHLPTNESHQRGRCVIVPYNTTF